MPDKPKLAWEKLREQIAQELYRRVGGVYAWEGLPIERPTGKASYLCTNKRSFYDWADSILALSSK